MNIQKIKIFPIIISLLFLSAGCNPFAVSLPSGIVKSVNGGADWQFANKVASSTTASLASVSVSKLAFDPGNHEVVYAGTYNDGLFKSQDSAASWSKVLSKIFVYDFAINPYDNKTIYAAGTCVDHGCVLKTTDGGASWNEVYHEGSPTNTVVRGVALNPLNPNQIVIGTTLGTVLKSADAGNTWQLAKDFSDKVNRVLWQDGNIYVLLKAKGLFVSANYGGTFNEMTASLSKTINVGSLSYTQSTINSFNQVFVDFTSPSLIYITTDKGLQKSVDEGKTWVLVNLPIKPDQAKAYAIAIARQSSNIVFASVGSTIYKSLDAGQTWQTQSISTDGLVNYVLIDPPLTQIVYGGIFVVQQ